MESNENIIDHDYAQASAQYDDLKGTAAADESDSMQGGLHGLKRLLNAKGFPIGLRLYKSKGPRSDFVSVSLFTLAESYGSVASFDVARDIVEKADGKPFVRRYSSSSMPIHEFLSLFKRFEVSMCGKGIKVDSYEVIEDIYLEDNE